VTKLPVAAEACVALGAGHPQFDPYPMRPLTLSELPVLRALPVRGRRMIGPWCFLDRFGPHTFREDAAPMDVAPHPHIGLQTVTWLLEGEILHDDSLAQEALLRPGGVNVMTAGNAIAHAERTPRENTGRLNGVQLWTALPELQRHGAPSFQHVVEAPALELAGGAGIAQVFSGAFGSIMSPAHHFSDLMGADVQVHPRHSATVPLQPQHEHVILLLTGDCALEGQVLESGSLYYLGTQRFEVTLSSKEGARVLLIGGPPFPETILMWWNFVARTPEEIRQARDDWEAHQRFGDVPAYRGPRLPAPDIVRLTSPNPVS
jgi:redox-sensitive bicupin YhaK (pirin superfamily)